MNEKLTQYKNVFTKKQFEIVKDNLSAYLSNMDYLKIEKEQAGRGFYVFTDEQRAEYGNWTQFCYDINYLNGWLYGVVQAVNGIIRKTEA